MRTGALRLIWSNPKEMQASVAECLVGCTFSKRAHTGLSIGPYGAVPGVEPGSSGSQPLMLTTTPYDQTQKSGGAGYRSLCLTHAKRALYHLSYTPTTSGSVW